MYIATGISAVSAGSKKINKQINNKRKIIVKVILTIAPSFPGRPSRPSFPGRPFFILVTTGWHLETSSRKR